MKPAWIQQRRWQEDPEHLSFSFAWVLSPSCKDLSLSFGLYWRISTTVSWSLPPTAPNRKSSSYWRSWGITWDCSKHKSYRNNLPWIRLLYGSSLRALTDPCTITGWDSAFTYPSAGTPQRRTCVSRIILNLRVWQEIFVQTLVNVILQLCLFSCTSCRSRVTCRQCEPSGDSVSCNSTPGVIKSLA